MNKFLSVSIFFFGFAHFLSAQTTVEWTNQKQTQIKYLLQQIAANKVYIEYLGKGYKIARQGLGTINDIKSGDFKLHLNFLDSLWIVNPKIKNWAKVAAIVASQLRIVRNGVQAIKNVCESGQFNSDEVDYCKVVFDNLFTECLKNIDELFMVVTNGQVSMSDDERISRIEKLYADMNDKAAFTASFSNEMEVLALQRLTEQVEINYSKKIKGF
ncbi:MAG: hypothetical protein WDN26_16625 [Chitinophagaceae bacterium]